jgi:4-oxalocrotonate tautomerase
MSRSHHKEFFMPLVRIELAAGKPAEYRRTLGNVVHGALVDTIKIPSDDRFQVITEHAPADLVFDPTYLGIQRSADFVVIQITLSDGRSVEQKRALYTAIADGLHAQLSLRREDVFINLLEVRKENWSFGNGEAQYAV